MALTENEQFYQKPLSGNIVTTSGDITTTEMDFSLTVSDNRSSTCKPVSYRIITYFNWKYHYITHSTDEVAVGWGGSCNSTNLSRTLYYGHNNQSKKIYSGSSSNDVYDDTGRIISRSTETINQGILTSIECGANANYTDYYNCLKKGYIYTTIYKNNKDNFSTKVLARYGHLVPHIGFSASMSFGGAPGISIGLGYGYDYTYQASWDITT